MIPGTRVRLSALGREACPEIADSVGITHQTSHDGKAVTVQFDGESGISYLRVEYVEMDGLPERDLFG
jgi:uncharacterized protein RhaS with RHS repeats